MPPAIVPLADEECRLLLGRNRLCVLSVVDGSAPYAVPLFYGFDDTTVYLGVAEGRKTRALDVTPALCLTVTEIGPGDAWACVQVTGRAEWLAGAERAAAVDVLMRHNRHVRSLQPAPAPSLPPASPPVRHQGGRILRVADVVLTGRKRR